MAKPAKPSGIAADIAAMKAVGMTNEQIQAKIMGAAVVPPSHGGSQGGSSVRPGMPIEATPSLNAHQRQDRNLGPDPEVLARHEAAVKAIQAAPKAILEETVEVTFERREIDYVRQFMALTNAKRPNSPPIDEARAVRLIVKAYRIVDPDRALMEGARGRTAPKALPPADWAQKTA